jgi:hypothetical protein
MMRPWIAAAALAWLVGGCHEEPTIVIRFEPADLAKAKPGKPAECKVASDCDVEPVDCCDCSSGGKQHAVTKVARKAAYEKRCDHVMCTMMLSTDPSCPKHPDCVAGACMLVDNKH